MAASDLIGLFTAPAPVAPGTRERAGTNTSQDTAGLPITPGRANPSAGREVVTGVVGNVPYPRSDDPKAQVRVVLGRTIAGCPEALLDTWLAGTGTLTGVYANLPAKLAVTDNVDRRVAAVTELDRTGRLTEMFKRSK